MSSCYIAMSLHLISWSWQNINFSFTCVALQDKFSSQMAMLQALVQWVSLYQEQILYCSKTHSLPNKAEKAARNCLLPCLWLPVHNFQSSTSQSLTEQLATVLSLVLQNATPFKRPCVFHKEIWPTLPLISKPCPTKTKYLKKLLQSLLS